MPVRFTILGSGSAGNCAYLETDEIRLLIDAGLSGRQTRQRLAAIGRSPESLHAILITHEHSDHIQALPMIAGKLNIPVYCNRLTREAAETQLQTKLDCRTFTTGAAFDVGDVHVETFSVPHDAYDPVNFFIRTEAGNIGFLTDLGHATKLVVERVRESNVLLLEANHDVKMLQDDPRRPWSLKQRILSRHGHLSNDAAAAVAGEIVNGELKKIYLGHLSRDCNTPDLALGAVNGKLQQMGATHVHLEAASQSAICETLEMGYGNCRKTTFETGLLPFAQ